jgi:hypothetical protein
VTEPDSADPLPTLLERMGLAVHPPAVLSSDDLRREVERIAQRPTGAADRSGSQKDMEGLRTKVVQT